MRQPKNIIKYLQHHLFEWSKEFDVLFYDEKVIRVNASSFGRAATIAKVIRLIEDGMPDEVRKITSVKTGEYLPDEMDHGERMAYYYGTEEE